MDNLVYRPYKNSGTNYDIYICRIAPNKSSVVIDWISGKYGPFVVEIKENNVTIQRQVTYKYSAKIDGLKENSEYSVTVTSDAFKSNERLFVTGDYLFDVINYVHPKETQYLYSGNFLGSPSITRFKGDLYVTMDIFKNGGVSTGHIGSYLYVSKDEGKSWAYVCDFVPAQWGRLFTLNDKLCFISSDLINKEMHYIESIDGVNFSKPTIIRKCDGYVVTTWPTQIAIYQNKIYVGCTYDFFNPNGESKSGLLIGDINKDLLNEEAWTYTNTVTPEFSWGGDQTRKYMEEGNVIEYNGDIYMLFRFAFKKAVMLKLDKDTNELKFDKVIDAEFGWCKFFIEKDKKENCYYAMGNTICFPRHVINLYKSKDLEHWEKVKNILDISNMDKDYRGVQYPSFFIENDNFYTIIRTALNGSETFHNSNAITFSIISKN